MIDPREYAANETLKGGLCATVRALHTEDRERVAAAVRGLDRESIYFRLFSYRNELTETGLDRIMKFDAETEVVLVVTIGADNDEKLIGSGRYIVNHPRVAEVAFAVEEDYHGRGVASRILRHLAIVARDHGIETFEADVLAENAAMLKVFERAGWPTTTRREGGVVHVAMSVA